MFRFRSERTANVLAVILSSAVLLQASSARADVDSVQGVATGVIVAGFLGSILPTPTVTLSADETSPPGALGPFTSMAASTSLPGFPGLFSTGALSVSTSAGNVAGEDHAGRVEARAMVQNVNAGAGMATATSITSACTAGGDGSTGSTVIEGGVLNGVPFANGTPTPNTVVEVPGLGTVTLNEQVRSDVAGSASITVNAVHARYASGPGGILPSGQSAEAIIGQVVCRAVGPDVNVPTTTTTISPVTTVVRVTTTSAQALPTTGSESYWGFGVLIIGTAALLWRLSRRSVWRR